MSTHTTEAPAELSLNGLAGIPGGSSIAAKLLANKMNVNALRNNVGTLTVDEWGAIDNEIVGVFQAQANAIGEFVGRGLTKRINGMAASVYRYDQVNEFNDAEMSMLADFKSSQDNLEFTPAYMPLPIIHKDFSIDVRTLNESRNRGEGIDTTGAAMAALKVTQKAEELFVAGATYVVAGKTLYGIVNHGNVNSVTLSTYGNWDASGGTGPQILKCVNAMIQASVNDGYYGPWGLFIPTAYASTINYAFNTTQAITIGEVLMNLPAIGNSPNGKAIQFIKPHSKCAANTVVLVPLDNTQVQVLIGLDITNVPWESSGGLRLHHKVMAIILPLIKVDVGTKTGIVKAA